MGFFAAVDLAQNTVVEKLRRFGGFCLGDGFGEEIQDALQTRFRSHELAAEARFFIKLIAAVEHIWIGFLGVFADHLHREGLIGVVALDAARTARSSGTRRDPSSSMRPRHDQADVLIGLIHQADK